MEAMLHLRVVTSVQLADDDSHLVNAQASRQLCMLPGLATAHAAIATATFKPRLKATC